MRRRSVAGALPRRELNRHWLGVALRQPLDLDHHLAAHHETNHVEQRGVGTMRRQGASASTRWRNTTGRARCEAPAQLIGKTMRRGQASETTAQYRHQSWRICPDR